MGVHHLHLPSAFFTSTPFGGLPTAHTFPGILFSHGLVELQAPCPLMGEGLQGNVDLVPRRASCASRCEDLGEGSS